MKQILRYDILLPPLIDRLQKAEYSRALKARKESKQKPKTITSHFVSVNSMYPISRGRGSKYLSTEGKVYKDYIDEMMGATDAARSTTPIFDMYECSYVFYFSHEMMFNKDDSLKEKDVSNLLKAAEDAVFEYLLESDATVMSIHGYKRLTVGDPRLVVLLSPATMEDTIRHGGGEFDPYDLEVA